MIETINLLTCSYNEKIVLGKFYNLEGENGKIRPDHYDGEHGIFRFAAVVVGVDGEDLDGEDEERNKHNICKVLEILESLEVKPTRAFIGEGYIDLDWFANNGQIARNKEEYFKASLEFARYLDSIKSLDIIVQEGMYSDDPEEIQIVEFSERCFGRNLKYYPAMDIYEEDYDGIGDSIKNDIKIDINLK